jgi:uncharacterized protein YbgA (DUF1722 family)
MPEGNRDLTAKMLAHARRCVGRLEREGIAGCLLKSRSPSCGLSRVKTFAPGQRMRRTGRGLFAKTLMEMLPDLPVEEDDRMHDPAARNNWIERVFAYGRLGRLFADGCKMADLAAFHDAHRLALMSHSCRAYGELGRILHEFRAKPAARVPAGVGNRYRRLFMAALCRPATRTKNAAVLRGVLAVLEPGLEAKSKRRLAESIEDYCRGDDGDGVPLVVPRTLLAHYAQVLDVAELRKQVYLRPSAAELALRNHS